MYYVVPAPAAQGCRRWYDTGDARPRRLGGALGVARRCKSAGAGQRGVGWPVAAGGARQPAPRREEGQQPAAMAVQGRRVVAAREPASGWRNGGWGVCTVTAPADRR